MLKPMLKIFVLSGKGGCDFWRALQPCEEMRRQGLAEVRYLDVRDLNSHKIAEGAKWCDVLYIRGLIGVDGLTTLRRFQSLGVKVATDYDDLHFNVSPFNPAYRHFGLEEITVRDPLTGDIKKLWEDGKNGLDISSNKAKFHSYQLLLQECDLITTTSLYLKEAMAEISGREDNIKVLPNAIDFNLWKPLDCRDKYKDKFRFGWAVSNSHGEDWLHIKGALSKFLNEHTDAKFVCIGDSGMDIKTALPKEQVEWHPFSDLWELHYPLRMAMLGLDAAIAPLADSEFNKCKSPLKFAEYTAFGWPVIAQDMTPYKEHIVQGETGLLATDTDSWVRCLNSLYSNESQRSKLRFNAMFTVKNLFDLKTVAREYAEVYSNLLGVTI